MSNKTLLFFTSSFPFGKHEAFIENEIDFLANGFSNIKVITNDIFSATARSIPKNVEVYRRSYHLQGIQKLGALSGLFKGAFWKEMWFVARVLKKAPSVKIVFTALAALHKAVLLKKFLINELNIKHSSSFTAYAYWSDDNAVALSFLKKHFQNAKVACRAHRWDVYYEPQKGEYLPFRWQIANEMDSVFFISTHAKNFFENRHRFTARREFLVARLGTLPIERLPTATTKNHFHIVSCSSVIPRKRVLLLAESIAQISSEKKIRWTHFGDGSEMDELRLFVKRTLHNKPNISVELKGRVDNELVRIFYAQNSVDVFVNVSTSEGVPVSMMEAMSAAIPVIATNVDAVAEIVQHQHNGLLLPASASASLVAETISAFMNMNETMRAKFKQNAFDSWQERYNALKNYQAFAKQLGNL